MTLRVIPGSGFPGYIYNRSFCFLCFLFNHPIMLYKCQMFLWPNHNIIFVLWCFLSSWCLDVVFWMFLTIFIKFSSGKKLLHFAPNLCKTWYQPQNYCNNLWDLIKQGHSNHALLSRYSKPLSTLNFLNFSRHLTETHSLCQIYNQKRLSHINLQVHSFCTTSLLLTC